MYEDMHHLDDHYYSERRAIIKQDVLDLELHTAIELLRLMFKQARVLLPP